MQTVPDKWYKFYHHISFICAVLLVVSGVATMVLPQYTGMGNDWGFTTITLGLGIVQLIYFIFISPVMTRRTGMVYAAFYVALLQVLTLITIIQATGRLQSLYLFIWGALILTIGMFGTSALVGGVFMTFLYVIAAISSNQEFGIPLDLQYAGVIIVGVLLAATISHFIWRTQYKKSENQRLAKLSGMLANKDQQAEILIESIADGVVLINTEGKISLMNTAAAGMSEWPIDEALGIDVQLVMKMKSEDDKDILPADHPFARALIKQEKVEETLKLQGRSGKEIIISVVISPVILPGKKEIVGVVAVIRDISAAREEESRRADFVSTASHEMRTPVAAIEGYLQLALNDKVSQVDIKARSYLEKALDSTHHLGQLFQDLLTSAKAEDGRLVSHPVVVEMGKYLEEVSDSLKFSAEKKGLLTEFIIGVSQDGESGSNAVGGGKVLKPLYYVHVDPDRLREVLTNIFDNAVKYTDTGKISIGLTGNNDVVQFYVHDTGPGIAPEDLPHLFQKFYRVDNSNTRSIGGTGLGLFICKKIVEMYKGRIWVESTVGQGSTFYMNFPRLSAAKATEMQAQEAAQPLA